MRRLATTTLLACLLLSLGLHGLGLWAPWPRRDGTPAVSRSDAPPELEIGIEAAAGVGSPEPAPTPEPPPAKQAARPTPPDVRKTKAKEAPAPAEPELPTLPALPAPAAPDPLAALPGASAGDSVEAQRGRLGAAAACADPVAGTWKASFYDADRGQWYVFTLNVKREGAVLSGAIESKFWLGGRRDARPPSSCAETSLYAVVSMPARGVFGDGRVRFAGGQWQLEHLYCGRSVSYSPDRFSGTLDLERNEFQSLVSDGASLFDQPLVLRHVGCGD